MRLAENSQFLNFFSVSLRLLWWKNDRKNNHRRLRVTEVRPKAGFFSTDATTTLVT